MNELTYFQILNSSYRRYWFEIWNIRNPWILPSTPIIELVHCTRVNCAHIHLTRAVCIMEPFKDIIGLLWLLFLAFFICKSRFQYLPPLHRSKLRWQQFVQLGSPNQFDKKKYQFQMRNLIKITKYQIFIYKTWKKTFIYIKRKKKPQQISKLKRNKKIRNLETFGLVSGYPCYPNQFGFGFGLFFIQWLVHLHMASSTQFNHLMPCLHHYIVYEL